MNKNIINKILDEIDDKKFFQKLHKIDPELTDKYFVKRFMDDNVVDFYIKFKKKLEYNENLLDVIIDDGRRYCHNCGDINNDKRYCLICERFYCLTCCEITEDEIESIIADEDEFCSKVCILEYVKNEEDRYIKCTACCKYYGYQSRHCKICQKKYCNNCLPNYKKPCENCI